MTATNGSGSPSIPGTSSSVILGNGITGSGGNSHFGGKIHEVMYFSSELNDFAVRRLEGYLAWKWGAQASLVNGHPSSRAVPSSAGPKASPWPRPTHLWIRPTAHPSCRSSTNPSSSKDPLPLPVWIWSIPPAMVGACGELRGQARPQGHRQRHGDRQSTRRQSLLRGHRPDLRHEDHRQRPQTLTLRRSARLWSTRPSN